MLVSGTGLSRLSWKCGHKMDGCYYLLVLHLCYTVVDSDFLGFFYDSDHGSYSRSRKHKKSKKVKKRHTDRSVSNYEFNVVLIVIVLWLFVLSNTLQQDGDWLC